MEFVQEDCGVIITTVGVVQAIEMLNLVIVMCHLIACLFYLIGRLERRFGDDGANWIDRAQQASVFAVLSFSLSLFFLLTTAPTRPGGSVSLSYE